MSEKAEALRPLQLVENCASCRYGFLVKEGQPLQCRAHPPVPQALPGPPSLDKPNQPSIQIRSFHPPVDPKHWCGEWKIAEQQLC